MGKVSSRQMVCAWRRLRQHARKVAVVAATLALAWAPIPAEACTGIYFGSDTTASGDVIYGRSEDIGTRYPKQFGIAPATSGKTYWSGENGPQQDPSINFTRTSAGPTYRYTFVRDLPAFWQGAPEPYAEAGVNECGVSVDATVGMDCNEAVAAVDPLVATGLGEYCVTDVVLSEASSAREGVELLGSIVDAQGSQSCNHLWIADAGETWTFHQLSGHQWIALRATANEVSVDPNMGSLRFVADLSDGTTCLHSQGIEMVAQDAGTAVYDEAGRFDVAQSYGVSVEGEGPSSLTRYVQGHLFLGATLAEGTSYELDETGAVRSVANPQLFVAPARRGYELLDAMRLLATRGEGTPLDGNVNGTLRSVGSERTAECHLFQIHRGMAPQIATIEWLALSPGEFTLYIPSYAALLTEVDPGLYPSEEGFDLQHTSYVAAAASGEEQALEVNNNRALNQALMDIYTLAAAHRPQAGTGVHAYLDAVQLELIAQQAQVDRLMRAAVSDEARTELANTAHAAMSRQAYERASGLLDELRAYVQAGDFGQPFAASGLGADGQLAEPLTVVDELQVGSDAAEATQAQPQVDGLYVVKLVLCGVGTVALVALALALHKARK